MFSNLLSPPCRLSKVCVDIQPCWIPSFSGSYAFHLLIVLTNISLVYEHVSVGVACFGYLNRIFVFSMFPLISMFQPISMFWCKSRTEEQHFVPGPFAKTYHVIFPICRRHLGFASARDIQVALPWRTCVPRRSAPLRSLQRKPRLGRQKPDGQPLHTARPGLWRSPGPRSRPTPVPETVARATSLAQLLSRKV